MHQWKVHRMGIVLAATLLMPSCARAAQESGFVRTPAKSQRTQSAAVVPNFFSYDFLHAFDPLFRERVSALAERSATWRAALDTLRESGFEVIIGRPDQIRRRVRGMRHYHAAHLGEVIPRRGPDGEFSSAVIVIDMARLRGLWRLTGLPRSALIRDIDRILIHELYGHVVPLARTRELAGGCPDPRPDEPARSSCAIRRENRIRAELGIDPRTSYDLSGLVIGQWLDLLRMSGELGRDHD